MVVGLGQAEFFVASDNPCHLDHTLRCLMDEAKLAVFKAVSPFLTIAGARWRRRHAYDCRP